MMVAQTSGGRRPCPKEATLPEFEKHLTVMTGADAAFDYLSDPVRLPEYVPALRLEDSIAVEGELDVDADIAGRGGAPDAGFDADRATRTITWGRPGSDYGGSIVVTEGTTNTAGVTIHLRTRDDADNEEVARIVEQTVSNMRRVLSGR